MNNSSLLSNFFNLFPNFRDDILFVQSARKYAMQSDMSEQERDAFIEELTDNIGLFGELKLKGQRFSVENGAKHSLSKLGHVYKRKFDFPKTDHAIVDFVKHFLSEGLLDRTLHIEEFCRTAGLEDLVVLHSGQVGSRLSYLYEGRDLREEFDERDENEKDDLAVELFRKHLELTKRMSDKSNLIDNSYIYTNSDFTQSLNSKFFQRLGIVNHSGLERCLEMYRDEIAEELNSSHRYLMHGDPKLSNNVRTNGGEIKALDLEFLVKSPLQKLVYEIHDKTGVSRQKLYLELVDMGFVSQEEFDTGKFEETYRKVQVHEDLLNAARYADFAKVESGEKRKNHKKIANYYFNRALREIGDSPLTSELEKLMLDTKPGLFRKLCDEKYKETASSISIQDKQWSRSFPSEHYETSSEKFYHVEKTMKRRRIATAASAVTLGATLVVGLALQSHILNEREFQLEISNLHKDWEAEHRDLTHELNPCDFIDDSDGVYYERYEEALDRYHQNESFALASVYGAGSIIDSAIRHYGHNRVFGYSTIYPMLGEIKYEPDEDLQQEIFDMVPRLLWHQIRAFESVKYMSDNEFSTDGHAIYDNWMHYSYKGETPYLTHGERSSIHNYFPCFVTKEE